MARLRRRPAVTTPGPTRVPHYLRRPTQTGLPRQHTTYGYSLHRTNPRHVPLPLAQADPLTHPLTQHTSWIDVSRRLAVTDISGPASGVPEIRRQWTSYILILLDCKHVLWYDSRMSMPRMREMLGRILESPVGERTARAVWVPFPMQCTRPFAQAKCVGNVFFDF